ncbi:unnamed protein product, partial [Sphacelaria rigidula]
RGVGGAAVAVAGPGTVGPSSAGAAGTGEEDSGPTSGSVDGGACSPTSSFTPGGGVGTGDLNSEHSGEGVEDSPSDASTLATAGASRPSRGRSPVASSAVTRRSPIATAQSSSGGGDRDGRSGNAGRIASSRGTIVGSGAAESPSVDASPGVAGRGEVKRPDEISHGYHHRHSHHRHPY